MPKYLLHGSYSTEGNRGIIKGGGGSARRKAVTTLLDSVGGKLESFYWALGTDDFYLIVDVPDAVAMAAVSMQVGASGAISRLQSTMLLTAADVDKATKRKVKYSPPGK